MQRLTAIPPLMIVLAVASMAWSAEQTAGKPQDATFPKVIVAIEECFNRGDAKGLAALWTPKGYFTGPHGQRIAGREKIESTFQEFFAAHKNCRLQLGVVGMRLVSADVAVVDAVTEMTPAPEDSEGECSSTILLVRRDGRWLIDSIRETVGGAPSHHSQLKDLEWMVGNWTCKADGSSSISVSSTCDWTANGSFLIRKFSLGEKGDALRGTEVIGWDPRTHRIRSWVFESDGGFGESEWTRDGNCWTIKYKGVLADGSDVSATHVLTHVDANTQTLESTGRTVNGQKRPDIAKVTIKRCPVQEASPMKPNEPARPPRQVLP